MFLWSDDAVYTWHGSRALPRYRRAAHRVYKQLFKYEGAVANHVDVDQVSFFYLKKKKMKKLWLISFLK